MPRNVVSRADEKSKEDIARLCDVFAQRDNDFGRTSLIQQQINPGNHLPIKQVPRRVPLAKREEMESRIESMKGLEDIGGN